MVLFENPDQALLFALRFSSQQYAQSPMAKQMKRTRASSGKGLVALDGAGQAGMVKARLEKLDPLQRACIVARYSARVEDCPCCGGQKALDEYREAIAVLADWSLQYLSSHLSVRQVRTAIVQDFFERRRSVGKIADEIGVPRRTAYDQKTKIWPHLSQLDKLAAAAASDLLGDLCGDLPE